MTVLLIFNALASLSAIVCAQRSYRRHGVAGRALVAGLGGLFILPLVVVLAVAVAAPRTSRIG
ncbi:hypothetical protein [Prescottella equi]|uniref:hypothetical protein n=1 Tax=Rhodococcus hoagii TaxID=43767 RepID=UPI0015856118|nr:hypothetical protein [Prescottella equi]